MTCFGKSSPLEVRHVEKWNVNVMECKGAPPPPQCHSLQEIRPFSGIIAVTSDHHCPLLQGGIGIGGA